MSHNEGVEQADAKTKVHLVSPGRVKCHLPNCGVPVWGQGERHAHENHK